MRIGVQGKTPLEGTYSPGGSSNAALMLIAASLLSEGPVTLHNVPATLSVSAMLEVAALLGTQVEGDSGTVTLHTPAIPTRTISAAMMQTKVGVVLFVAAILARRGHLRLEVPFPLSRLYTHLTALRDLGCRVLVNDDVVEIGFSPWQSREIVLVQTSVTATAVAAMLAASHPGETVIHNAASEPQVRDLLVALRDMGADIRGVGSNLIAIRGAEALHGTVQTIGPDHIEVASVAAMAALSGGRLDIAPLRARDLTLIAKVFARLGLRMDVDEDRVHVPRHESFEVSMREEEVDLSIETAPWPGFPSDLAAMATVVATQAQGNVLIHEKLFNNRLLFVDILSRFGAQIVLCDPHRAVVVGRTPLTAAYLDSPDIRSGLALLAAALCAEGETTIDGAEMFDWNFDNVLLRLQGAGAQIRVLSR